MTDYETFLEEIGAVRCGPKMGGRPISGIPKECLHRPVVDALQFIILFIVILILTGFTIVFIYAPEVFA